MQRLEDTTTGSEDSASDKDHGNLSRAWARGHRCIPERVILIQLQPCSHCAVSLSLVSNNHTQVSSSVHGALVREKLAWRCGLQAAQALGKNTTYCGDPASSPGVLQPHTSSADRARLKPRGLGVRVKDVTRGWTSHKKQKREWTRWASYPVCPLLQTITHMWQSRAYTTLSVTPSDLCSGSGPTQSPLLLQPACLSCLEDEREILGDSGPLSAL